MDATVFRAAPMAHLLPRFTAAPSARAVNRLWLIAFAVASSVWIAAAAWRLSATFDEPTYLHLGLHAWRTHSHAPLVRLGTMPLPADWQTLPLYVAELWRGRPWDVWAESAYLLPWMRLMNLAFWWLLLHRAMRIGRRLGGDWAGRVAVAALACEPNFLAHASLATADVPVVACLLAFADAFVAGRGRRWRERVAWPGVWFGAALLAKASALVFGPVMLLVMETSIAPRRIGSRALWRDVFQIAVIGTAVMLVAVGSDFRPEPSFVKWAKQINDPVMLGLAENLCIFSNGLEGLVQQIKHNLRGHGQYLLGYDAKQPFWWYFPVLLTIKLTLPLLFGIAWVVVYPRAWRGNWPLAVAAVLLALSLTYRVQIGVRLVLPLVAFATVGVSVAVVTLTRHSPVGRATIATALAWMAVASLKNWPDGIRYVNELWGGPANGYRLVNDSNYDWGQGLYQLAEWKRSRDAEVGVWYFGSDPAFDRTGLVRVPLHQLPVKSAADVTKFAAGRYLAVSPTLLYCHPINASHCVARDHLLMLTPIDRTPTYLIYEVGP